MYERERESERENIFILWIILFLPVYYGGVGCVCVSGGTMVTPPVCLCVIGKFKYFFFTRVCFVPLINDCYGCLQPCAFRAWKWKVCVAEEH